MHELIADHPNLVRLRMTDRLWSILLAHRLSFGARGPAQLPVLELLKSARIEQYADYTNGTVLAGMGAFSYQMCGGVAVEMGRYCSVADHLVVMGERHPVEHVTTSTFPYRTPRPAFQWAREDLLGNTPHMVHPTVRTLGIPVLEHDVWTGNQVVLQRGITLHTGCIVGAGAVVTRDVPPYAIVGGNPARIIRMRFPAPIVERLLASRWWDCHPRALFTCDIRDPARFLDQLDEVRAALPPFTPKILTWQTLRIALQPSDA